MEAEGEIGGREDGEGFGEDVGGGFVAEEVRVELVPGGQEEGFPVSWIGSLYMRRIGWKERRGGRIGKGFR